MAIEASKLIAMCNLGNYYETVEKNTELAIKYYSMVSEKGNDDAFNVLNALNKINRTNKFNLLYWILHRDKKLKFFLVGMC